MEEDPRIITTDLPRLQFRMVTIVFWAPLVVAVSFGVLAVAGPWGLMMALLSTAISYRLSPRGCLAFADIIKALAVVAHVAAVIVILGEEARTWAPLRVVFLHTLLAMLGVMIGPWIARPKELLI